MPRVLMISFTVIISVNLIFILGLNFPLWRISDALKTSTALAAKLACSGTFISGFSPEQNVKDLSSYSPAIRLNHFEYDMENQIVRADFMGFAKVSAHFRPGVGCSLQYGDSAALDLVRVAPLQASDELWPAGESVTTINPVLQSFLNQTLQQDNQQGFDTRALVVVKDGRIVAESYKAGITPTTPLLGWSMAKSVVAIMLGHMEYRGQLVADEQNLFPEWRDDNRADIRLQQLMQMTSGLAFDESYLPGSDVTRMLFTQHSASEYALTSPLEHAPGEYFYYSSGTSNLLTRLLYQRLGGTPQELYDYLYQDFFRPLGMTSSWFEPDASGILVGSSYPYFSARDWARLALLMLNEGELNGVRMLSPDWVQRATVSNSSSNDPRYGYQFWLNGQGEQKRSKNLPEDMYFMQGNRSQVVAIFPSQNLAVIRLGWSSENYSKSRHFRPILTEVEKQNSGTVMQ